MGLEITFFSGGTAVDEGNVCATPHVDLFEAPDALKYQGVGEGTVEGIEEAGFLPTFVKAYRERFGSGLQEILAGDESDKEGSEDDDDPFFEEMMAHMEAGGCAADFLPEPLDILVEAGEVADWADLWLRIMGSEELKSVESRQALFPYNHESFEDIHNELQSLSRHAHKAKAENRQLRMTAILD